MGGWFCVFDMYYKVYGWVINQTRMINKPPLINREAEAEFSGME